MAIKVENLSFSYKNSLTTVLQNISLTIQNGSVVTLLGLNGCGKTTFIKCLAGIFQQSAEHIFIDNSKLSNLSYKERSKIISYVPQKIVNVEDVFIKDYLTYGMVNTLKFYERPGEREYKKVEDISNQFEIHDLLNKKMGAISGGERQKIAICAALLQNTKIILLDEPTSALDLRNQNLVLKTLKNIAVTQNKTIVLSSHNPNHALLLNSNVALMNNGKIEKYGSASQIINTDTLKTIYGDNICYSKNLPYDEISFNSGSL